MHPLGFVILRVWVEEIASYDEDVVFLMMPDELDFAQRVPIMIGTCTLSRIVNMIKESEMDWLSMPWVVARMSSLLSWQGNIEEDPGVVGDGPNGQGAVALPLLGAKKVDELVLHEGRCVGGTFLDSDFGV